MTLHALIRALVVALTIMTPFTAQAETVDDFLARVAEAYAFPDKQAALRDLFFMEGMDADTVEMYDSRIIGRMLGKYDEPSLAVEPLPADFDPVQVGGGYEYRPNLEPLGYVVVGGKTSALYGGHGDRYYLVGVVRTLIENPAGPEQMLQMVVMGFNHPQIGFDGHCDVLLANNSVKRVRLDDEGLASKTMIVTGVRIEACELRNLSERGSLMLRLLEGDDQIFDHQADFPENTISFAR
ncbi:MAG: hypothetical protein IMF05_09255 [Proteobacteria bacterium]|nr:hypothetical protein [Pseudomonadota bacterium]